MFFETIYCWFISLFGEDLADYLSGYVCDSGGTGDYTGSNQFVMYGFIALGTALAIMLIYYYVINHPNFARWWSWLLMLLLVGAINFFIGAGMTLDDLAAGNIGECLMYSDRGGIFPSNCWMFGLANFFISAVFFVIFSICLKWWSVSCKRVPF